MRRRFHLLIVLTLGLAIAGGAYAAREFGADNGAPPPSVAVESGTVEATVTSLGALQPKDYVDVGAQVSGQLQRLHVEIGDMVGAGSLLAEIDPRVYATRVKGDEAKLAGLRAQLRERQAQLELRRLEEQRSTRLFQTKAVSEATLQTAQTATEVAAAQADMLAAQIREVQATLEGDQTSLSYTKIFATMGGTIVSTSAVEGQTLNANQTTPTILRIADLATMTVWAEVAEADINKLKPGMRAWFTTLGMPDRRFIGTVIQLLPTPEIVNDVVLYNVLIDVPNPEGLLMTSMTVQVFFELGRVDGVPVVPLAALRAVPGGAADERTVRVVTAEGSTERRVRIGLTNRTLAEVRQGLVPGERVEAGAGPGFAALPGRTATAAGRARQ